GLSRHAHGLELDMTQRVFVARIDEQREFAARRLLSRLEDHAGRIEWELVALVAAVADLAGEHQVGPGPGEPPVAMVRKARSTPGAQGRAEVLDVGIGRLKVVPLAVT